MDEALIIEIILNKNLEKLMESIRTPEDVGESKRILEYFEKKGYDVKEYKERQAYKEKIILSTNIN